MAGNSMISSIKIWRWHDMSGYGSAFTICELTGNPKKSTPGGTMRPTWFFNDVTIIA